MRTHGLVGYGLYWCIVEDLYNNANAMRLDYDGIAYDLRTKPELVRSIINDFGLFVIDNDKFSSDSIKRRLLERTEKSENARKSANKRWHNADALPTQSEGNAIKERKGKKRKKGEEIIDEETARTLIIKTMGVTKPAYISYAQEIMEKFGREKALSIFRNFADRNFHSVETMRSALDETGNIKSKDEQQKASKVIEVNFA